MTITIGSELTLSNITTDAYDSAPLGSNAAIVVNGRDAEIISVSGLVATENAKTEYNAIVLNDFSRVITLDSTNAIALVASSHNIHASHLTISGISISASALQDLLIDASICDISTLSSSSFLLTYNDTFIGGGYAVVVSVSGSTFTVGTPAQFTSTTNLGSMSCSAYGALQAVVSWAEASPGAGNACFLSITGTSVSVSTPKFVYDAGNIAYIAVEWLDNSKAITTYRLDSTGYTWASILQTTGGGTPFVFSATADVTATPSGVLDVDSTKAIVLTGSASELNISGSTITLGDVQSITGSTDPLSISRLSSTSALCVYDIAGTKVRVIQFTTSSANEKILSISTPALGGSDVWLTVWRDNILYLQKRLASTGGVTTEYALGAATESELNAKTYVAYVRAYTDDRILVFGRMDAPQGLSSPTHVMYSSDGGSSFSVVESGWGADNAGAMVITSSGRAWVIRNESGGYPSLYGGTVGGTLSKYSTLLFQASVNQGAFTIDDNGNLVAAADAGGSKMVLLCPPPYYTWADITSNYPSEAVNRVIAI